MVPFDVEIFMENEQQFSIHMPVMSTVYVSQKRQLRITKQFICVYCFENIYCVFTRELNFCLCQNESIGKCSSFLLPFCLSEPQLSDSISQQMEKETFQLNENFWHDKDKAILS